jgi:crotonobetainyl-CoA:carnitine CoA-transferase CaiB-like acyl-CoA transferase
MDQALSDVTVIDLGQVIAMPFCTMLLADMGARVIKVESRERGRERVSLGVKRVRDGVEERVPAAQYRDRNKLGITLELKTPKGAELFKELVARADVVTENWSVGTMERLGLGYEDLKQVNPRLVYASITAFGQNGPYAEQRGYDMLAQAISGYMSITGFPEHPPTRSGQSISDYYAGMLCAFSIVSALHYRHRTGKGQHIDLALYDTALACLGNMGSYYLIGGEQPRRAGNGHFASAPNSSFDTSNGKIYMAVANQKLFTDTCKALGHPEWASDPRFAALADRVANKPELTRLMEDVLKTDTKENWAHKLRHLPAGPIRTMKEALDEPEVKRRGMLKTYQHSTAGEVPLIGSNYHFSDTPVDDTRPPPALGEHTDRVLGEVAGLSAAELAALREKKVVG